ncbi:hypothetical protein [Actinoplanes palleronii]|uniref:hypothetical protein n=1 Tax=Actinoplanes palleronii TaxID=113570 RepID=UPI00194460DE|nr:hypothetical protein [Actinoplanes palleronii]
MSAVLLVPPVPGGEVAPLPIDAVLGGAGETTLVVDVGAAASGARTVTVTSDDVPQKARLLPVVSPELTVSMVVDASAEGADALPGWLSAAARFSLAAPARTRSVVIADRRPAAVIAGPVRGPSGVVRALGTVRAAGERDTEAALTLATRQFPGATAGRRVVLLYTTAAGIAGLSAPRLADRFRAAGILLVVVGTTDPDRYWSSAAAATGGFFAPAEEPAVVSALDQVETTLSGRCLVRFATPARLPARIVVRVTAGGLVLSGETTLGQPVPEAGVRRYRLLGGAVAVLLVLPLILLVLHRRRSRRRPVAPDTPYAVLLGGPALPIVRAPLESGSLPGSVPDPEPARPSDPDSASMSGMARSSGPDSVSLPGVARSSGPPSASPPGPEGADSEAGARSAAAGRSPDPRAAGTMRPLAHGRAAVPDSTSDE